VLPAVYRRVGDAELTGELLLAQAESFAEILNVEIDGIYEVNV